MCSYWLWIELCTAKPPPPLQVRATSLDHSLAKPLSISRLVSRICFPTPMSSSEYNCPIWVDDSGCLVELCLYSHKPQRYPMGTPVTPIAMSSTDARLSLCAAELPDYPRFSPMESGDALQNPGIPSLAPCSGHRPEALAQTQMTSCCMGPASMCCLIFSVGISIAVPCCVAGLSPS